MVIKASHTIVADTTMFGARWPPNITSVCIDQDKHKVGDGDGDDNGDSNRDEW